MTVKQMSVHPLLVHVRRMRATLEECLLGCMFRDEYEDHEYSKLRHKVEAVIDVSMEAEDYANKHSDAAVIEENAKTAKHPMEEWE